jgi:hypothetical protein
VTDAQQTVFGLAIVLLAVVVVLATIGIFVSALSLAAKFIAAAVLLLVVGAIVIVLVGRWASDPHREL